MRATAATAAASPFDSANKEFWRKMLAILEIEEADFQLYVRQEAANSQNNRIVVPKKVVKALVTHELQPETKQTGSSQEIEVKIEKTPAQQVVDSKLDKAIEKLEKPDSKPMTLEEIRALKKEVYQAYNIKVVEVEPVSSTSAIPVYSESELEELREMLKVSSSSEKPQGKLETLKQLRQTVETQLRLGQSKMYKQLRHVLSRSEARSARAVKLFNECELLTTALEAKLAMIDVIEKELCATAAPAPGSTVGTIGANTLDEAASSPGAQAPAAADNNEGQVASAPAT